jgi:hypothetical protein
MAGLCAAIAAARHGAKVALMQDRPVLGGNASSECRVHICGADRHGHKPNLRETGILEELRMENLHRNRNHVFSIWDTILYEKARYQPGITLLLNCSCIEALVEGGRIRTVTGWQLTTYTRQVVAAKVFIDCSGDAVLAPLVGAEYRVGREARDEFGESIAPLKADRLTMGMSCVFQARQYDTPQPFTPPSWAHRYDSETDLPYGVGGHRLKTMGYWWLELGGQADSIHDTELLRDELLRVVYGVWDHIKNRCEHRESAANLALEWIQFLPAKRESRRYVGACVLNQNDIAAGGKFDDVVAYGGWSMDDHHPAGFEAVKLGQRATIFHEAPSPYGIPYRSLYSRNVPNLMFAGRCASCTHAAMSSTRVMGTGAVMGQAAGTAAAMAARLGVMPAAVLDRVGELQQALLRDDCYLPGVPQQFGPLTVGARLTATSGDPQTLRDGVNRPLGPTPDPQDWHRWPCRPGDSVTYELAQPALVSQATVIVDSAMDTDPQMSHWYSNRTNLSGAPPVMPRDFDLLALVGGQWRTVAAVRDNYQRLVRMPVGVVASAVRWELKTIWNAPQSNLYAFYID